MRRQKQTKPWVTRTLARHRLRLFLFRESSWQLRRFCRDASDLVRIVLWRGKNHRDPGLILFVFSNWQGQTIGPFSSEVLSASVFRLYGSTGGRNRDLDHVNLHKSPSVQVLAIGRFLIQCLFLVTCEAMHSLLSDVLNVPKQLYPIAISSLRSGL